VPVHRTDAHVTVHVLDGAVTFSARGADYALSTGDVLVFGPGVEHEARSATGGVFLLTVVYLGHNRTDESGFAGAAVRPRAGVP
jgi:quercetin dioxygenase-like cupin family protein